MRLGARWRWFKRSPYTAGIAAVLVIAAVVGYALDAEGLIALPIPRRYWFFAAVIVGMLILVAVISEQARRLKHHAVVGHRHGAFIGQRREAEKRHVEATAFLGMFSLEGPRLGVDVIGRHRKIQPYLVLGNRAPRKIEYRMDRYAAGYDDVEIPQPVDQANTGGGIPPYGTTEYRGGLSDPIPVGRSIQLWMEYVAVFGPAPFGPIQIRVDRRLEMTVQVMDTKLVCGPYVLRRDVENILQPTISPAISSQDQT